MRMDDVQIVRPMPCGVCGGLGGGNAWGHLPFLNRLPKQRIGKVAKVVYACRGPIRWTRGAVRSVQGAFAARALMQRNRQHSLWPGQLAVAHQALQQGSRHGVIELFLPRAESPAARFGAK